MQQQCSAITDEVLLLYDTAFVWDRLFDEVVKPSIAMALGVSATSDCARTCHEIYEAIKVQTAATPPPGRLLAQLEFFLGRVPGIWDRLQAQHAAHAQQEAQRQSTQALLALAAASSARRAPAGGVGRLPPLGLSSSEGWQLSMALRLKDDEYEGKPAAERGCRLWSGMEGSCRKGPGCPDAASHVPRQPSAWYAARNRVWAAHGGVRNELGNWALPRLSGVKRPALVAAEVTGGLGRFRPPCEDALAELLGQVLAADLAGEAPPVEEAMAGLGLECGAQEAGLQPDVRPVCSRLPAEWDGAQQVAAVEAAWYDVLHSAEQLASVYQGLTDQEWMHLIESCLLSGDSFQVCSLQRHAAVWQAYAQLAGIAGLPLVEKVLSWVRDGYPLRFVDPCEEQQQLHPRYAQRLWWARRALSGVVPAHQVEAYLHAAEPEPALFPNNASCAEHSEFVRQELQNFVPWRC